MRASLAFTLASSLAVVALSAVLVAKGMPALAASAEAAMAATASTDASSARDAGTVTGDGSAGDAGAAPGKLETLPIEHAAEAPTPPEGDFRLADGTPVPPLDRGAPRQVRFGVILVTYGGAEGAPEKGARRKPDALALAAKLADEAKSDFHGAVVRGDTGSSDDVGEVTRGVLEPAPEAVLFTLPAGGVSGVVDTPRGLWIVKRLE
jgi:hypothetical protein